MKNSMSAIQLKNNQIIICKKTDMFISTLHDNNENEIFFKITYTFFFSLHV